MKKQYDSTNIEILQLEADIIITSNGKPFDGEEQPFAW